MAITPRTTDATWAKDYNSTGTTSASITRPTGIQSGDLIVAVLYTGLAGTITPPSGFTLIYDDSIASNQRQCTYWKVAGGSEPATYTWTIPSSTGYAIALWAASGAASAGQPEVSNHAQGTANPQSVPGYTTLTDQDYEVMAVSTWNQVTYTTPSGWTLRANNGPSTANDPLAMFDHGPVSPAGVQAAVSMAFGAAPSGNIEQRVAIKPAAATKAPPPFRKTLRVWNRYA